MASIDQLCEDLVGRGPIMVFVDGENIAIEYEKLLTSGRKPVPGVLFESNHYAWTPSIVNEMNAWARGQLLRVTYYVAVKGDSKKRDIVEDHLKASKVDKVWLGQKRKNQKQTKQLDVALAVDALFGAASNHYDQAVVLSGDEDYVPAIDAIDRLGKRVVVWSFAASTSKKLKSHCHRWWDLQGVFFRDDG